VALIPLILFLVSTGFSSKIDFLYLKFGRKMVFNAGMIFMIIAAVGLAFLVPDAKPGVEPGSLRNLIYLVAVFIGAA
jgi:hypothetical protein